MTNSTTSNDSLHSQTCKCMVLLLLFSLWAKHLSLKCWPADQAFTGSPLQMWKRHQILIFQCFPMHFSQTQRLCSHGSVYTSKKMERNNKIWLLQNQQKTCWSWKCTAVCYKESLVSLQLFCHSELLSI